MYGCNFKLGKRRRHYFGTTFLSICLSIFVDISQLQPWLMAALFKVRYEEEAGCAWLRSIVIVEDVTAISRQLSRTFPSSVTMEAPTRACEPIGGLFLLV